jgi:hypothetical protein
MNGFAEAAIGLAFAMQVLALDTTLPFFDLDAKPQQVRMEAQAAKVLATQKLMRNPWERAAQPAEEAYRAK